MNVLCLVIAPLLPAGDGTSEVRGTDQEELDKTKEFRINIAPGFIDDDTNGAITFRAVIVSDESKAGKHIKMFGGLL